jgi:hypothetical protein
MGARKVSQAELDQRRNRLQSPRRIIPFTVFDTDRSFQDLRKNISGISTPGPYHEQTNEDPNDPGNFRYKHQMFSLGARIFVVENQLWTPDGENIVEERLRETSIPYQTWLAKLPQRKINSPQGRFWEATKATERVPIKDPGKYIIVFDPSATEVVSG